MNAAEISEYLKANLAKAKIRYAAGDFTGAMLSAAKNAKRLNQTMYVFKGNSFMHTVFHTTNKLSMATCNVSNTGGCYYAITPETEVDRIANH